MTGNRDRIIYTHTDEAPALATYSLLPIIKAFATACDVTVETRDISLAGRIISNFPENLTEDQRIPDALTELGELATRPEANIIKLPNISASIPQMKAAIAELQAQGYALPDYPDEPQSEDEKEIRSRYDRIKGSAVNPILREGNSDRRAPKAVKQYAMKNPHPMGAWSKDSKTHVAHMDGGDFRSNEKSTTIAASGNVRIELAAEDGSVTVLKDKTPVLAGEVIDATTLNVKALRDFLEIEMGSAREQGVLFSLHLKATMMKVSDPIIFGHAVRSLLQGCFRQTRCGPRRSRRERERWPWQPARGDPGIARSQTRGNRNRYRGDLHPTSRSCHGELRSRHHESPCAERHHRRPHQCPP